MLPQNMGMGHGRRHRRGRRDRSPANFSAFNIMPMGGAWKDSTSNDPRPPIVATWRRPWYGAPRTVDRKPHTFLDECENVTVSPSHSQ